MDKEKILEKLIQEHNELNEKIKKTNAALEDEDISLIQRMLMAEQEKAMSLYAYFLAERIDDLSQEELDEDENDAEEDVILTDSGENIKTGDEDNNNEVLFDNNNQLIL